MVMSPAPEPNRTVLSIYRNILVSHSSCSQATDVIGLLLVV